MSERPTRIELNKIAMLVVGNPEGLRDAKCDNDWKWERKRLSAFHQRLENFERQRNRCAGSRERDS